MLKTMRANEGTLDMWEAHFLMFKLAIKVTG